MATDTLSLLASLLALVISVVTMARARKAQNLAKAQSEYVMLPRLTLGDMNLSIGDDRHGKPQFEFSGRLTSHSSTPVRVSGVFLEYGCEIDEKKRVRLQLLGPLYLSEDKSKEILANGTDDLSVQSSLTFDLNQVHYWITIVVSGIYNEEIVTRYFILYKDIASGNVRTHCPHDYAI